MPIFFQQDINGDTRLGVWKIEEEEAFFSSEVPLQRDITHPHKRLQHLAGRFLLKHLFPDFPFELIQLADTRKPFLENEAYHFSISHSGDFAAVIVSRTNRVGVDIETISPKIETISPKFISPVEKELLVGSFPGNYAGACTLAWSCKEAVFKWYGLGGVDFREHLRLISVTGIKTGFQTVILMNKSTELFLNIESRFFEGACLSYVVT